MKPPPSSPHLPRATGLLALAIACGFLLGPGTALAVTNYFDVIPSTSVLDGGAGNWGSSTNWKTSTNNSSGNAWSDSSDAWFQSIAPLTNNLGGNTYTAATFYANTTLGMLVLTNGSLVMDKIVATGNSNLTLNLASVSIGAGGISNNNTGSKTINLGSNVTLTANQTWRYMLASGGDATIAAGQVALGTNTLTMLNPSTSKTHSFSGNLTGSGNVIIDSKGTGATIQFLSGTNTYDGYTLVLGTLGFASGNNLVQASGVISNQGQIKLIGSGGLGTIGSQIVGTGVVNMTGSGNGFFTITNANTYSGGTLISGNGLLTLSNDTALSTGPIIFAAAGRLAAAGTTARTLANSLVFSNGTIFGDGTQNGLLTLSGNADFTGAMRPLTISSTVIMSGVLSDGGFTKLGAGTLVVSNANNNYALGTTNIGGAIALGNDNVLGSGTLFMYGGTLQAADATARTLTNAVILIPGSNAVFGAAGTGNLTLTHPTLDLGTGTRLITVNGSLVTLQGSLTNAASLVKAGSGTLTLGGANLWTGGAILSNGTLSIASEANAGGASSTLTFAGGLLQVTGTAISNLNTHAVNWSGLVGGFDIASAANTFTVTNALPNAALIKAGAGTLVLNNAAITNLGFGAGGGTLRVLAGTSTLAGGLTISNASTLMVSGTNGQPAGTGPLFAIGGSTFNVGNADSGNRLVIGNGGTITNGNAVIGSGSAAISNSVLVTGSGSTWTNAIALTVGNSGSYNTLTISNGGGVVSASGSIGSAANSSNNAVLVSGEGSTWNMSGALILGNNASAVGNTLTISNGGKVYSGGISVVGNSKGAPLGKVILTGGGSLWTNNSLKFQGQSNELQVLNGAVFQGFDTFVGGDAAATMSSNNTVIVANGGVWTNLGPLNIGQFGNGNRFLITNGGTAYVAGNVSVGKINSIPTAGQVITNNQLLISDQDSRMAVLGNMYVGDNNQPSYQLPAIGSVAVSNGGQLTASNIFVSSRSYVPNCTFDLTGTGTLVQTTAFYVGADASVSTGSGGLGRISDGAILDVVNLKTGANNNFITNSGGILQFATNAPTITAGTAGSIVATNATIAFRDATGVNVKGNWDVGALGRSLKNITFAGENAFRLNNASTTNGGQDYVFDTGRGATNYTRLEMINGTTLWQGGSLTIGGGGTMLVSNTAATVANAFTNQGSVRVVGSTLTLNQPLIVTSNASFTLVHATNVLNGGLVIASNASYGGSGRVESGPGVTSFGTISPGNSPGTLTFSSNLTLLDSSVLMMEIASTNAGDYDRLVVNGAMARAGTLTITNIGSWAFALSNRFDLFDFTSWSGSFSVTNLPSLSAGLVWDFTSFETQGVLLVGALPIPEPSPFLAAVAGLALLAFLRRRRA